MSKDEKSEEEPKIIVDESWKTEAKKEMFGYVEGGYSSILPALERHSREQGVELLTDTPIRAVRRNANGHSIAVETTGGQIENFDTAVLTVPCPLVNAICPDLSGAERQPPREDDERARDTH